MKPIREDPSDLYSEEKPRGMFTLFSFLFYVIMFISWLFFDEAAIWVIAAGVSFLASWHKLLSSRSENHREKRWSGRA